ncbi:hypothetical protein [Bradyrhizobium sp. BRP56]|uniref:hypothetical protein n=1 Tax=Bradyrhizobium sp. BRP56 TaxID=2793819 RepID=UPI001CD1E49D|nr:hypothetical protein [Bradyrhizobium sp. BRP56]MCA1402164.1 hypothetical protein [Bradyrhizobium sp. BRP56]
MSKSIACPVADLMVPALSTENLAAVVLLLPDAPLIWMASSADWIVAPALLTTDSVVEIGGGADRARPGRIGRVDQAGIGDRGGSAADPHHVAA